jgi:hypothetical protein
MVLLHARFVQKRIGLLDKCFVSRSKRSLSNGLRTKSIGISLLWMQHMSALTRCRLLMVIPRG